MILSLSDELRVQKQRRDYRNEQKHGHTFDPDNLRCRRCGMYEIDYSNSRELGSDGGDRPLCFELPTLKELKESNARAHFNELLDHCYTVAYAWRNV